MAAIVSMPPALPRFDKVLEIQDFSKSCALYNELLDDVDQPTVADEHIENLAEMFVTRLTSFLV
ncbi:hypothetical protein N7495_007814 [Penicillium taxi]|uniref:uncharacterized protein n=1 Tax=Penicillium taxi TaxID=168475 RepID=UPI0025453E6E|nr:uncharacterized protein N7495_007814 [Penicillium taxi]KAJ5887773.1 hypothetical protein N7495_007814 [Penicillium taxi]